MDAIKERMQKTVDSVVSDWGKVRTGMATPSLLDNVMVDYWGTPTPLTQVANVSSPEPRVLAIAPWEKPMLEVIEKAIYESNLGLTPQNDGSFIRLNFPILTQDRRKELCKQVKKMAEDAKVAIRNIRRDENDKIKKEGKAEGISEDEIKGSLAETQVVTDSFIAIIDKRCAEKEEQVLKV